MNFTPYVHFDPERVPAEADREYSKDDDFWWATVTGDTEQSDNVRWEHDGEVYSFTGLAKEVLNELVGRDYSKALNGYKYWCHPDFGGRTLDDLRSSDINEADRESEVSSLICPRCGNKGHILDQVQGPAVSSFRRYPPEEYHEESGSDPVGRGISRGQYDELEKTYKDGRER